MTKANLKKAFVEVDKILSFMPEEKLQEIPVTFFEYIEENKQKDYIFEFNPNADLEKEKMLNETRILLEMIYLRYWADEEEKKRIYKKLDENEQKYVEMMNEKIYANEMLGNNKTKIEKKEETNLPVEYKETVWQKMISFIKNIFVKGEKK